MADQPLIFGSDTLSKKVTFTENVSSKGVNFNNGDDDDLVDDASEADDDPNDDDFRLEGFGDLGIPSSEIEPHYNGIIAGKKRKRIQPGSDPKLTKSPRRSFNLTQAGDEEAFILEDNSEILNTKSSRVPGTFGRRNRRKGESLPAYHKRVSHELDSDDELMMQMRGNGFSDRQIAEKLAKDGRVRYDQKSISTRIMRIRLAQAENVDFLLREGYKEWEVDDDKLLIHAYALADIEINYEMERIRAWRFRKVSEYMRRLNAEALFSATACRERYNALITGNARIPTEEDDDPDARRVEMETYRINREHLRNEEKTAKEDKEAAEAKAKHTAKALNAQKAEELANSRAQKEAEKAERAMARAASARMRANRAAENSLAKTQRNAQIKKQRQVQEAKKHATTTNTSSTTPTPTPTKKRSSFTVPPAKDATKDTPDPRSYLSVDDLVNLCNERGLDIPRHQTVKMLVQALRDADDEYTQKDLQKMCKSKRLPSNVNKTTMKYQLALATAKGCASFEAGVAAAGGEEEEEEEEEEEDGDEDEEMDMDME
ncbi:hypothetical protein CFE70_009962 [Pyrenophora teres f. teres 0-1]|uniref:DUF7626 domain-containing protein n=1 Tax=Pyrenophora teres f. teres (strain 0-1) TaxID=861557 RepID=E3S034_PYRTT|nr:hypothetical protein PTT_15370 [Pyrenophora teres f. teres 0-1]KAE8860340.1 hypothetical protein PTNB73_07950 [Pyrenophora teres f. teres]